MTDDDLKFEIDGPEVHQRTVDAEAMLDLCISYLALVRKAAKERGAVQERAPERLLAGGRAHEPVAKWRQQRFQCEQVRGDVVDQENARLGGRAGHSRVLVRPGGFPLTCRAAGLRG